MVYDRPLNSNEPPSSFSNRVEDEGCQTSNWNLKADSEVVGSSGTPQVSAH